MALIDSMAGTHVELTLSLFGQHRTFKCVLVRYEKPFIEVQTREGRRMLNENAVKEIIPC
jgi:hypothetical protein